MLCNRIKQFREYNKLDIAMLSGVLGIPEEEYIAYEKGKKAPTIDIITALAKLYKVTVDEFYGYTPRITLHSKDNEDLFDNVSEATLKMADLSWDEAQIILYYRKANNPDDEIIKKILEEGKKD